MAKVTLRCPPTTNLQAPEFLDNLFGWGWFYPANELNNPNRGQHSRMDKVNRSRGGLLGQYDYYPDRKARKIASGIIIYFEMGMRYDHASGYIAELEVMPKALVGTSTPPVYYLEGRGWTEGLSQPNNVDVNVVMYRIDFSDRNDTQVNIRIEEVPFGSIPRPDATFKIDSWPSRSDIVSTNNV